MKPPTTSHRLTPGRPAHVAMFVIVGFATVAVAVDPQPNGDTHRITVTVDRGRDVGQNFGSLFEVTSSDGSVVIGAGFQNLYNTRYRADRHSLQFFVRPTSGKRAHSTKELPRPNDLCGTYLYGRDEVVHSTYGGVKGWRPQEHSWEPESSIGGTNETMRVGDRLLTFGGSEVKCDGRIILSSPQEGSYQLFFYANGHLCFYHVNPGNGGYRPYKNDSDGFSRLYACPWTTDQPRVDLSGAIVLTLPIVGETTFAWGQLGDQIVTGSNIGGFYIFEDGHWRMPLAPKLGVSYQLYSTMIFHDRLLMGQYPSGRVFQYDGDEITDVKGWPPVLDGVSPNAREAQTTVIYAGDVFVGVWPWGELWRYNPDRKSWTFTQRMFDHPVLSNEITHPYDVENQGGDVGNQWGQRVTSLVPAGSSLFVSTSAKWPAEWDPDKFAFLAPDKWKSYGSVYKLTMSGHLGAATKWTDGPTTFEFHIHDDQISITQDGDQIAMTTVAGDLTGQLRDMSELINIRWGQGIYGQFGGDTITGTVHRK
ncbi:MAG: hypothetical protein GY903_29840 [Fuerstiella sp.]|nr:hypothetical protein [Fuerstiella sp.]MCP4858699.1 hypothetical protein [Fuerstiella sp.]